MTVPISGPLFYSSAGNGSTTNFSFPERFMEASDLVVEVVLANGARVFPVLNADYTLSAPPYTNGATVIFAIAPVVGNHVRRYRKTAAKQIVDLENLQKNDANSVESQLDRKVMAIQDINRDVGRAFKADFGLTGGMIVAGADGTVPAWVGGNLVPRLPFQLGGLLTATAFMASVLATAVTPVDLLAAQNIYRGAVTNPALLPGGVPRGALMYLDGETNTYNPLRDDLLAAQKEPQQNLGQTEGLYIRTRGGIGNDKVSPNYANPLPDYWAKVTTIPFLQQNPADIYQNFGLGLGAMKPMGGGRSTGIGYLAGSDTLYADSTGAKILVGPNPGEADPIRYALLTYLPGPWFTMGGERAGRLSQGSALTAFGQQAMLGAFLFNDTTVGRFAMWGARGIFNTLMGNNAGRSLFGIRNSGIGDQFGLFATLDYCGGTGQRALAYAVAVHTIVGGWEAGAYGVHIGSQLFGNRAGHKANTSGVAHVGDLPDMGGLDTAKTVTINGTSFDVPNSRIQLPAGTLALWGIPAGGNKALTYEPAGGTGLIRAPEPVNDELDGKAFVARCTLEAGIEWLYTWGEVYGQEAGKRTALWAWFGSSSSDRNPFNAQVPTVWTSGESYSVRWPAGATVAGAPTSVVTNGGATYFCLLPHVASALNAPGAGAEWATYWLRCDPAGQCTFTPYFSIVNTASFGKSLVIRSDNSLIGGWAAETWSNDQVIWGRGAFGGLDAQYGVAVGPLARVNANHLRSAAFGYNAQTTAADQIVLGAATVTKLELGGGRPVQFITASGTFTPVLKGSTTDPTVTYTTQEGRWHIVDTGARRMCRGRIFISTSAATGGTGNMSIQSGGGTPPPVAKAGVTSWGRPVYIKTWLSTTAFPAFWRVLPTVNVFELYQPNGASDQRIGTALSAASVNATTNEVQIDFEYEVV